MAQAKEEEYLAWYLRSNASAVEEDLVMARRSTIDPILELLPADRKAAFREAAIRGEKLPAYALQQLQELEIVTLEIVPIKPILGKAHSGGPYRKPAPIVGSIDAKLNAFADLKRRLDRVSEIIPSQEKELAEFGREARILGKTHNSLWERFQAYESPMERAQALVDDAERRILNAQINQKISANNLLKLAAAAILWNNIKEKIVIPQMEQILGRNGLLKGVRGIALMDKIRRSPKDFLPKVGAFKDLPRLIEVSEQIVTIEENWESYALATADASGQLGIAESDTLIVHIFSSLGKSGAEIMRTASGAMEGTQGKIARASMERAPKE